MHKCLVANTYENTCQRTCVCILKLPLFDLSRSFKLFWTHNKPNKSNELQVLFSHDIRSYIGMCLCVIYITCMYVVLDIKQNKGMAGACTDMHWSRLAPGMPPTYAYLSSIINDLAYFKSFYNLKNLVKLWVCSFWVKLARTDCYLKRILLN